MNKLLYIYMMIAVILLVKDLYGLYSPSWDERFENIKNKYEETYRRGNRR